MAEGIRGQREGQGQEGEGPEAPEAGGKIAAADKLYDDEYSGAKSFLKFELAREAKRVENSPEERAELISLIEEDTGILIQCIESAQLEIAEAAAVVRKAEAIKAKLEAQ